MRSLSLERPQIRIAVVSLHTSPLDPPGTGDSGGMNVEIRAIAERLSARGVAVDVFTRCSGRPVPQVDLLAPMARVIQVPSGPCAPVPRDALDGLASGFAEEILRTREPYDLVHAHYWRSAAPGAALAAGWGAPLVASFHTLAEIKNRVLADGEPPEPLVRVAGEREAVRGAGRLVAPTATEARHLVELYAADPERVRLVPPGVDHELFFPRDRAEARRRLGLGTGPVVLFLGRVQPVKGPEVAVRAFALASGAGRGFRDGRMLVVGGPSGPAGEATLAGLRRLSAEEGIAGRVTFLGPRPHEDLPWIYSAADLLLMPSRSESFGLAALEAQACGVPVVAADVGGLGHLVEDGLSGVLVPGHDPADHAAAISGILEGPATARRLARGARTVAARFDWERSTDAMLAVYDGLLPGLAPAAAS